MDRIFPFNIPPGIQRDGTMFDSKVWTNGQWVRFQRGRAKKIGGYKMVSGSTVGIPRGAYVVPVNPNFNFYYGTRSNLQYCTIDQFDNPVSANNDRTPANFVVDDNNIWMFDTMFESSTNNSILVAHAAPNLSAIDNNVARPIYYGNSTATTPLIASSIQVSGGIVSLHPHLFYYGDAGLIGYTEPNDPNTVQNEVRACADKVVYGIGTRGGNSSPAGLFWSLSSVIRATNVGEPVGFAFDTVTNESSILSNQCVIEYDSNFLWCGIDRFLCYNGTVVELPNDKSINFFFENLNYSQRQKVFATKITQFGEIWWHFPKGNATECNHAVIYNVREGSWYDTAINRSDAYFDQTFAAPIWTDNQLNQTFNYYPIWIHETGVDEVDANQNFTAIYSSVTTPYISAAGATVPDGNIANNDSTVELYRFEPDMLQQGEMTITVSGKEYANSQEIVSNNVYSYTNTTEKIDMRENFRNMRLTFTSNAVGGYYEMGKSLSLFRLGDERA